RLLVPGLLVLGLGAARHLDLALEEGALGEHHARRGDVALEPAAGQDLHLLAAVHVAVDAAADAHAARGDVALDAALAADADAALDVDLPLELAVDHEVARAVHLPHDLGAGSDVGRRRAHDGSRLLAIALGNRWRSGRRVAGNGR